MPSSGSTTQPRPLSPVVPAPSSPSTPSPGRSLVQQAGDERLGIAVGVGDGIGLRALVLDAGRRPVEAVDEQRPGRVGGPHGEVEEGVRIGGRQEWRGPDLNRRHPGFQPSALPAELPRRGPHQASTGCFSARQSIGSRSSTSSPTASLSSLAASPPLMQSAAAPVESTRTTSAPGGTSANVRPRRAAPRGDHAPRRPPRCLRRARRRRDPRRSRASAQLPKRSTCAQGARRMPCLDGRDGGARRTRRQDRRIAERSRWLTECQASCRGSEHVTAVEGRRGLGLGRRARARAATPPQRSAAGIQQAVVGPDESLPSPAVENERATIGADARIDDGQMHPPGHVREGVGERPGARAISPGGTPWVRCSTRAPGATRRIAPSTTPA